MTNTKQINTESRSMIDDSHGQMGREGRNIQMNAWTEQNQVVIRNLIRERELEAASERLAASARTTQRGLRRNVGRLLILAGRHVAGEPVSSGSPAARPAQSMAA
ncbi:MAG: hypothetical protein ABIV26_00545 [Candidatus Limnocylindrales bacterium]